MLAVLITFIGIRYSEALTFNFEDLTDSERLTTQYALFGVTFTNATALTAGISLNEFEFPPHSGTNVIFDDGGPMTLIFSIPMVYFEGYFTYLVPLTLNFFDALNNLVGSANSNFSSNMVLSGDPGSSPNELLSFAWGPGISSVVISGDLGGNSFTMDDLTATPVPEPGTLLLLGSGVLAMVGVVLKKPGLFH
jgi:hypothetical protein